MKSVDENGTVVSTEANDYGTTFQHKLLYVLLTDKVFLEEIFEILNPSLFDVSAIQWVSSVIKTHYQEYRDIPDLDSFQVYIAKDALVANNTAQKYSILKSIEDSFKYGKSNNLELVKKTAKDFFKNQNLAKAIYESIDYLKTGDYDKVREKIDDAFKAGDSGDLGHDYKDDLEQRYSENKRNPVPTGWNILDQYLDGGLGAGELGAIIAMSSAGKSWWLCHLAARTMLNGKSVVYYNLEDSDAYIGIRIDSIFTGINTHDLIHHLDTVRKKITEKAIGNLIIKTFPSEITSINHLLSHVNRLKMLGKFPDLFIIDYGDVMSPQKKFQQDWLNQRQIFQEIKSFAQVTERPVWTASQANQSEGSEDIVQANAMQRSYAKVAPCNVILGLSRKIEDKLSETGRIHMAKNKFGPDGVTFPCRIDNDKGVFEIYNPSTELGKNILEKMNNGNEVLRTRMSQKFKEFKEREK